MKTLNDTGRTWVLFRHPDHGTKTYGPFDAGETSMVESTISGLRLIGEVRVISEDAVWAAGTAPADPGFPIAEGDVE